MEIGQETTGIRAVWSLPLPKKTKKKKRKILVKEAIKKEENTKEQRTPGPPPKRDFEDGATYVCEQ